MTYSVSVSRCLYRKSQSLSDDLTPSKLRFVIFVLMFLANCWLWMQGIHELGHVIAAILSSAKVTRVVWHFAAISRTDVMPNPYPLLVCWAGPLVGCVLPLIASGMWRRSVQLSFFSGFCLVANGAYVSVGSLERIGDAGVLLQQGSSIVTLWVAGGIAMIIGFGVWHRLGTLSQLRRWRISDRQIAIQAILLTITVVIQLLLQ